VKINRICFCLRRDALVKGGGDTGKVPKYAQELTEIGYVVDIVYSPQQLNDSVMPDVVHIFNMQTPYENYGYFCYAKKNNLPLLISTIHHQESYMSLFFQKGAIGRFLNFESYQYVSALAKEFVVYKSAKNLLAFLRAGRSINCEILDYSHFVLPLSLSEFNILQGDYDYRCAPTKMRVLQNAITFREYQSKPIQDRTVDVVVVGRIESRKNQLKIARALRNTKYKVIFVGDANSNHRAYFEQFIDVINDSPNLKYLGKVDQLSLAEIYKNTRVCLSNSWFEVVSQVDLEASSLGCKIVVSKASAIFDYFEDDLLSLAPDCQCSDILSIVEQALCNSYQPRIKDGYNKTWKQIASDLSLIYQEI